MIEALNLLGLLLFGGVINLCARASRCYFYANREHFKRTGRQYQGASPNHVWLNTTGVAVFLIGGAYELGHVHEFGLLHGLFIAGFAFLAVGFRELLKLEKNRIERWQPDLHD